VGRITAECGFERLEVCFMAVVNLASIKIMLRVLK